MLKCYPWTDIDLGGCLSVFRKLLWKKSTFLHCPNPLYTHMWAHEYVAPQLQLISSKMIIRVKRNPSVIETYW